VGSPIIVSATKGLVMFAIQSTSRVSAVIAAAGACLLLGACGGGSNGSSASGSSSSGSSSGSSSSAPAPANTATPAKGLLTGHFCTDFITLGTDLGSMDESKIDSSPSAAADAMDQIAADFDGLGKEAPAKIQKAMQTVAAQYSSLGTAARSGKSISDIKKQVNTLEKGGATGAALAKVSSYVETACA
jgi:hypothetical protein